MSGHFGNWERVAFLQAARGRPLVMVARPLDNPHLERLLAAVREATGNHVVHKRSAIKETVKALKQGSPVAFVIDQDFPEAEPHFVPFFGKLASTTPALGTIVARMRVPVLPVFAYPRPGRRLSRRLRPAARRRGSGRRPRRGHRGGHATHRGRRARVPRGVVLDARPLAHPPPRRADLRKA